MVEQSLLHPNVHKHPAHSTLASSNSAALLPLTLEKANHGAQIFALEPVLCLCWSKLAVKGTSTVVQVLIWLAGFSFYLAALRAAQHGLYTSNLWMDELLRAMYSYYGSPAVPQNLVYFLSWKFEVSWLTVNAYMDNRKLALQAM